MAKFPFLLAIVMLLLLFMIIINQSSSARTLGNSTPIHNHGHHKISFLMPHMLNATQPSEKPATTKLTGETPFKKPQGFFSPGEGIPIPQNVPTIPTSSSSTQSLDLSSIGFSFPTRATLQELEFGSVISIDEDLLESHGDELHKLGKAQGVYVASSEGGSSHMVAMTVSFVKGEYQSGLRLFGVHRSDVFESHVAVIGGTGKYYGANGYAAIKVVDKIGSSAEGKVTSSMFLLFDVYLS
ncbi:putative allene oxide cyclase/dirigent protein [Lupinus albus]|uniref:Dirigent protein n=1 Tax=Lupinus albus TaxID=3870 RepID=A0A6A4QD92_LUPAL|nr:putative allene oxide cyclase/dirigent protein [Lupinus albus]